MRRLFEGRLIILSRLINIHKVKCYQVPTVFTVQRESYSGGYGTAVSLTLNIPKALCATVSFLLGAEDLNHGKRVAAPEC